MCNEIPNGNANFNDIFDLGDPIQVITPVDSDIGFFIAFQSNLLIWGRTNDEDEAVLAITDRTGATIIKI